MYHSLKKTNKFFNVWGQKSDIASFILVNFIRTCKPTPITHKEHTTNQHEEKTNEENAKKLQI